MPHPERATDDLMGSTDGRVILRITGQRAWWLADGSGLLAGNHRHTRTETRRIRQNSRNSRSGAFLDGTRHLLRDVERALFLQELAAASEKAANPEQAVLQGPGENAGIIDIGQGYGIAFKIESHNHPSFIEPFQGAATGVGGILRDIFTMGARPLAVLDALRFGPVDDPEAGARKARIVEGVVSGISHYGNCFGVPTVGGECVFETCYNGNPLVNVFALGIVRKDEIFYGKAIGHRQSGDLRWRADRA